MARLHCTHRFNHNNYSISIVQLHTMVLLFESMARRSRRHKTNPRATISCKLIKANVLIEKWLKIKFVSIDAISKCIDYNRIVGTGWQWIWVSTILFWMLGATSRSIETLFRLWSLCGTFWSSLSMDWELHWYGLHHIFHILRLTGILFVRFINSFSTYFK